jgi:tungstate transport system ATP-binding protein
VILVTHDIGQARRLADDVVFMHHGRVLEYSAATTFFDTAASPEAQAYLDGRIVI